MTIPSSIKDREIRKFVESPTRPNQTATEVVFTGDINTLNVSPFGKFDKVTVTYPINTREIYTYSLSATDIGTVTVDYTDSSKRYLSVVTYNEL